MCVCLSATYDNKAMSVLIDFYFFSVFILFFFFFFSELLFTNDVKRSKKKTTMNYYHADRFRRVYRTKKKEQECKVFSKMPAKMYTASNHENEISNKKFYIIKE